VKEEERLSDGGGGESGAVLAGMEQVTPAAQGEFLAIPRPSDSDLCLFVCYFVSDGFVSKAIQIRLLCWSAVCTASVSLGTPMKSAIRGSGSRRVAELKGVYCHPKGSECLLEDGHRQLNRAFSIATVRLRLSLFIDHGVTLTGAASPPAPVTCPHSIIHLSLSLAVIASSPLAQPWHFPAEPPQLSPT
jgi:hypothetical protein